MTHPVYLVDDDAAVRKALSLLLETVGISVKTFDGPEALLRQLVHLEPGCLVMDIRMPMITGLKLQEKLVAQGIAWPTIIISGHGDVEACRRAFRNGAIDFLSKPIDEQDLIDAIQKGISALDVHLRHELELREISALISALTNREQQVLSKVADGLTTSQIASILDISPRTVETHRAAIGQKLGTTAIAEQTKFWLEGKGST